MKISPETLPVNDLQDVELLSRLLGLPHKILSNHDHSSLAPMVLHELGHTQSFGFNKAGYFVDNPDFNCLKGVAGYCSDECQHHKSDVWSDPTSFERDMELAAFHKKLAQFTDNSVVRRHHNVLDESALHELGNILGISNPSFLTWKMKHGNNGILIFEGNREMIARRKDILHNFAALLGLC